MFNINILKTNVWISGFILLFAILYISILQFNLPSAIRTMFSNNIFRFVFLSLLLIVPFDISPTVSISVILIFLFTMKQISEREVDETFENVSQ